MIQYVGVSGVLELIVDNGFMPHGMCYMWNPLTLWSNVVGDSVTALSYFMIPGFLIYFVNKRENIELKGVFLAFAGFIVSCGAVHAISVANVWVPLYNLSGGLKILMAVISLATVILMYLKMPVALKIPSPSELQKINERLRVEIKEKNELQKRLEEQTSELKSALKLLNNTQQAANVGSWRLNFSEEEVQWSDQTYRIHGIDTETKIPLTTGITLFAEDHWPEIHEALDQLRNEGKSWDREWQLIDSNKQKKWVRSIGFPVYEDGKIVAAEGMLLDVDAQKRASDELKERTLELEDSNKELESFSYSISHDLRAPLRSINGYSEILKEDYEEKLDEEGVRLLNVIRDSATKMGSLIDDILAFSRLGRKELERKKVDMNVIASSVTKDVRTAFEGNQTIRFSIQDLPPAHGDLSLLHQVYQNLIENAVKYSAGEKIINIEIGSREEDDKTIYYVKDNGVGFNMDYHDKIFGVFQRLHTDKEFHGTGVGLAIVKRIIKKHNGAIWAESEVGKGSTFNFTLEEVK
jgi:two-component system sensor kinase